MAAVGPWSRALDPWAHGLLWCITILLRRYSILSYYFIYYFIYFIYYFIYFLRALSYCVPSVNSKLHFRLRLRIVKPISWILTYFIDFHPKPILGADGDDDDGDDDGGRISSNLQPPFPSRPGITYPVRAPALTPINNKQLKGTRYGNFQEIPNSRPMGRP